MNIPRRMRRRFKVPSEVGHHLPTLGHSSSGLVHRRKSPASIHTTLELQGDGDWKPKLNPIEGMWNRNHGPNH